MIIYEIRAYFELTGQTVVKFFSTKDEAIKCGLAIWEFFEVQSEIRQIDTGADTVEIDIQALLRTASYN